MPVKHRAPKRRAPRSEAPLDAWAPFFAWGFDYFDDLAPYGINVADRKVVEAAWKYYADAYLTHWHILRDTYAPGLPDALPWALTALGDPRL